MNKKLCRMYMMMLKDWGEKADPEKEYPLIGKVPTEVMDLTMEFCEEKGLGKEFIQSGFNPYKLYFECGKYLKGHL